MKKIILLIITFLSITSVAYAKIGITYNIDKDLLIIRNGNYTMTSSPLDWKSVNDYWDSKIRSMFIVEYWDKELGNSRFLFSYDARRTVNYNGDSIDVSYRFPSINLSFTAKVCNKGKYFEVTIPHNTFKEDLSFPIISITFLPYLNAGRVGEKGYLVIPDGCGTIVQFTKFFGVTTLEKQVYGDLTPTEYDINQIPITLPILGCIRNNFGFVGIITEGDAFSGLVMDMAPGNGYYSIGVKFYFRKVFEDIYRKKRITPRRDDKDRTVRFYLLQDKSANYVGVGKVYREFLLKERGAKTLKEKANIYDYLDPNIIDVEIFMGVKKGFQLFDPVIRLTSFRQISWILDRLKDLGIRANLILTGWERSGFEGENPTTFPPFDSSRGLRSVVEKAKNLGHFVSLSVNFFEIYQNSRDFYRRLTLKSPVKLPVEQNSYRRGYIICPQVALTKFQRFYTEANKNGIASIELRRLGRGLIECFDDEHPVDRFDCAEVYSKMTSSAGMIDGGCGYGISSVDTFISAPSSSSEFFGGESIPLWQIALHGIVRYSFEPINLRKDFDYEFLKTLEYGALPTAMLTYESPILIRDTFYKSLFSSKFLDWQYDLKREYELFNRKLGYLQYHFIIDHRELSRYVYQTTYSDGTKIIVNYSNKEFNGIKPLGYRIIKGDKQ
ncbi:MAG: DUF5696 domain-containing protein [bacterium]|nr:DUF5696 domain-containing protein [bacterium]